MDDSELFVFFMSMVLAAAGSYLNHTGSLHPLYLRGNPAIGVVRLGVLLAMTWIGYVLWQHADPSVTGVYVVFYLVMGYAVVKLFGQSVPALFGARTRVDAGERRNLPAAIVVAAFTVATGLIFGGSLWGEADPVADGEGGWWIPVTFFLLGWLCLLGAFALFQRREPGRLAHGIQRERSLEDARAAAFFLLSAAIALTDAVSGDFWGWRHGLVTFGVLAGLLLAHEAFATWTRPEDPRKRRDGRSESPRAIESLVYLLLGLLGWGLGRTLDALLRAG